MMSLAIAEHMAANGVKTVGFIGFSDAYGEGWSQEFAKAADAEEAHRWWPTSAMRAPTPRSPARR